jgi:hypothetical protein
MSIDLGEAGHPAPHRHNVSGWTLLFALSGPPLIWWLQSVMNYYVSGYACYPRNTPLSSPQSAGLMWSVLVVLTALALAVSAISLLLSYRAWSRTREEMHGSGHDTMEVGEGRTRFLALSGMLTSALFFAAVVFNIGALVFVPPCG